MSYENPWGIVYRPFLHGVARSKRRNRSAFVIRGLDHLGEQLRRGERPRGVMDDDEIRHALVNAREGIRHRILPSCTAINDVDPLSCRLQEIRRRRHQLRRQRHQDLIDALVRFHGLEAALEDTAAAKHQQLLGYARCQPGAPPARSQNR
jgi:hypothetical protein